MTKGRAEEPGRGPADREHFIDRFLVAACVIALLAALLHGVAMVSSPPEAADRLFLGLDLLAATILGGAFLFRRRLSISLRVLALAFVLGGLAVFALTRSGFLGAGILLLCTLMVIGIASLGPRQSRLIVAICLAVPLVLAVPVATGHLQFEPALIQRQNHPIGWIFTALLLGLFASVSWTVIGHLRRRLLAEIDALESSRGALEASRDRAAQLAYFDPLTGLPNRAHLEEHVSRRIAAGVRTAQLFLVDIRGFRLVNALVGRALADQVLQEVASALGTQTTEDRFVARLGGDEFAVWIEDLDADEVPSCFDTPFRRQMATLSTEHASHRVEYSTAAASYPRDGQTFDECLNKAGIALRRAKNDRADSVYLFDVEMTQAMEASLRMRRLVEEAIGRREFRMAYQPKVRLRGERITGVEALARWSPDNMGPVSPGVFIPEITAANLMLPFGRLSVDLVLADVPAIRRRFGADITISINISPLFFFSRGFTEFIMQRVRAHGVDPATLVLEITEDVLLDDVNLTQEVIQALKAEGIRISLDDFGKGYSSLHYLSYLDLDEVKFDRAFVNHISDDERSFALLEYACSMASALGFSVVAEGVETRAQARRLLETDCEYAQGYLFGRPVTLDDSAGTNQETGNTPAAP